LRTWARGFGEGARCGCSVKLGREGLARTPRPALFVGEGVRLVRLISFGTACVLASETSDIRLAGNRERYLWRHHNLARLRALEVLVGLLSFGTVSLARSKS